MARTEPKIPVRLRENLKARRREFRESMRGMGPWGGVLYPLGMRVSPTRPHLGLCPPDPAAGWKMWSEWRGETTPIQPSL